MSGTNQTQSNYQGSGESGINNLSSEKDPTDAGCSGRNVPINGTEFFKDFLVQRPDTHFQQSPKEHTPSPKIEEKPFLFEKPETDFHLQVTKDLLEERAERNLLTDDRGVPIHDCRGDHPTDSMCQFCDGRRGSWAQPNAKPTKLFQQYQEAVLSSPLEHCTDLAAKDPGDEEESYSLSFGVFDRHFFE